jgi:hypothetical protein
MQKAYWISSFSSPFCNDEGYSRCSRYLGGLFECPRRAVECVETHCAHSIPAHGQDDASHRPYQLSECYTPLRSHFGRLCFRQPFGGNKWKRYVGRNTSWTPVSPVKAKQSATNIEKYNALAVSIEGVSCRRTKRDTQSRSYISYRRTANSKTKDPAELSARYYSKVTHTSKGVSKTIQVMAPGNGVMAVRCFG